MDLKWYPPAKKAFEGLKTSWKDKYNDALREISKNPKYGAHMFKEEKLKCNHRVRISDHRLVYFLPHDFEGCLILGVGHKPESYAMAASASIREILSSMWKRFRGE